MPGGQARSQPIYKTGANPGPLRCQPVRLPIEAGKPNQWLFSISQLPHNSSTFEVHYYHQGSSNIACRF